mmetsp:Transcript_21094/g.42844  ORF Transcript_21094/g.42844 Transcript_21094/m.42844 type:complete len:216 (+) Transcript_21094:893-1540(+)
MRSTPPHISTTETKGLAPSLLRLRCPHLRMFSMPSSATLTMRTSGLSSRFTSGGTQPWSTRYLICMSSPPEVAFEIAHAHSLRMSKSSLSSMRTSCGMIAWSTTACSWSRLPAVMLEIVQHVSLRMPLRSFESSDSRHGSTEQLMTSCVWLSSPVTTLPTVRSAGVLTCGDWCMSSSTSRRHTPASITAWIFSFVPSDKYDNAQHASVRTSSSPE